MRAANMLEADAKCPVTGESDRLRLIRPPGQGDLSELPCPGIKFSRAAGIVHRDDHLAAGADREGRNGMVVLQVRRQVTGCGWVRPRRWYSPGPDLARLGVNAGQGGVKPEPGDSSGSHGETGLGSGFQPRGQ